MTDCILGGSICLAVVFPASLLTTGNVIVSLLSTLTICLITVAVVGVIPLAGWKFGVSSADS